MAIVVLVSLGFLILVCLYVLVSASASVTIAPIVISHINSIVVVIMIAITGILSALSLRIPVSTPALHSRSPKGLALSGYTGYGNEPEKCYDSGCLGEKRPKSVPLHQGRIVPCMILGSQVHVGCIPFSNRFGLPGSPTRKRLACLRSPLRWVQAP